MNTGHIHALPAVTCPNCGANYIAASTMAVAVGQSGSHTHGSITAMSTMSKAAAMSKAVLAPEVVKEFAKPDPDAELNEWRKNHIG